MFVSPSWPVDSQPICSTTCSNSLSGSCANGLVFSEKERNALLALELFEWCFFSSQVSEACNHRAPVVRGTVLAAAPYTLAFTFAIRYMLVSNIITYVEAHRWPRRLNVYRRRFGDHATPLTMYREIKTAKELHFILVSL